MNKKERLLKSREIYDKIMKDGTYTNEQITEGYELVFGDTEFYSILQARKKFIGFHQYLFEQHVVMEDLDELFQDEDPVMTLNDKGEWVEDDPDRDYQDERISKDIADPVTGMDLDKDTPKDQEVSEELLKQKNKVSPKPKARRGRPPKKK
jgi:hypothetical protein